jgi:hypothetical protein
MPRPTGSPPSRSCRQPGNPNTIGISGRRSGTRVDACDLGPFEADSAIKPRWPNGKAQTSWVSVLLVRLAAAPLSTTTLGPDPIDQPLLFER